LQNQGGRSQFTEGELDALFALFDGEYQFVSLSMHLWHVLGLVCWDFHASIGEAK
jgi:hypothetical protein